QGSRPGFVLFGTNRVKQPTGPARPACPNTFIATSSATLQRKTTMQALCRPTQRSRSLAWHETWRISNAHSGRAGVRPSKTLSRRGDDIMKRPEATSDGQRAKASHYAERRLASTT